MSDIWTDTISRLHRQFSSDRHARFIIAVSGGADSTFAVHTIAHVIPAHRVRLVYIDHGLRPTATERQHVKALAEKYGMSLRLRNAPIKAYMNRYKCSEETAGRYCRYSLLHHEARRWQAHIIITAHQADDCDETRIMKQRKTAEEGHAVIASLSSWQNDIVIARPFLTLRRDGIRHALSQRKYAWIDDPSNRDLRYQRNKLRQRIRNDKDQRQEIAIDERHDSAMPSLVWHQLGNDAMQIERTHWTGLSKSMLSQHLTAMYKHLLWRNCRRIWPPLPPFKKTHVRRLWQALNTAYRGEVCLHFPGGYALKLSKELITVSKVGQLKSRIADRRIRGEGTWQWGHLRIVINAIQKPDNRSLKMPALNCLYIDADAARFPWFLRSKKPGDRFRPFGMTGRKTLKDFFIDSKIDASKRTQIPLFISGNNILCVGAIAVSDDVKVTPASKRVYQITIVEDQL